MRQAVAALLVLTATVSACSGGKAAAPTIPSTTPDVSTTAANTVTSSAPTSTEPTATVAPSTTVDEAAVLAEVEIAYL
jgi:hypothetical protein